MAKLPISQWKEFLLGPWRRESLLCYCAAVALLCLCVAVIGLRITSQTNHETDPFDQGAYLLLAGELDGAWYPTRSDGTRNPLFPWISTVFLDVKSPGFFESGKRLNVCIATLGTALLGAFFARRIGFLPAFNATAIASLAALLPVATFFGAEALFLVLFLFVCAAGLRLLNENPLWLYIALGALAAVAWLAKSSTTPFLGLFVIFSFLRLGLNLFFSRHLPWHLQAPAWQIRNLFLGLGLLACVYVSLISPRLIHAYQTWGSPTYSLPSFWFWADDWETCVEKYRDCRKEALALLPPEEQPSLRGYFHRHTFGDAVARVSTGAQKRLEQFFFPEGKFRIPYEKKGKLKRVVLPYRGLYIISLGALATLMGVLAWRRGSLSRVGSVTLPALLWLAVFALYVLATGWYLPTGPGHRFVMTLFIPTLWLLVQAGDQLRRAAASSWGDGIWTAAHLAIASLVASRTIVLLYDGAFEKISFAF